MSKNTDSALVYEVVNRLCKLYSFKSCSLPIPLHAPSFDLAETVRHLQECISSSWVSTSGPYIQKFEDLITDVTKARFVHAVSCGTDALRLALSAVNVKKDDEVILPPISFVASSNAISHLGAHPVFVDIEPESLGICPRILEEYLKTNYHIVEGLTLNRHTGRRLSAVIVVHVFGRPALTYEIRSILNTWNVPLVEDAAEALGSFDSLSHCGTIGDVGIFSFNGNKIVTSGSGGAVVTNNPDISLRVSHLSSVAKVPVGFSFTHDEVGWNDRMSNLNAALGYSQLLHLNRFLVQKNYIHQIYTDLFSDLDLVHVLQDRKNTLSNNWLCTIRLNIQRPHTEVHDIIAELSSHNIFARPCWPLMSSLPMYSSAQRSDLTNSLQCQPALISLPSSPSLFSNNHA